jgi:isopenicillin-N epimerase
LQCGASVSQVEADETVTILSHAYGAVRNAVQFITEQGGGRIIEANVGFPDPTEDSLVAAVLDTITPNTRLAVIDHITSGSGIVLPARRIVAACHAAGARADRRRPRARPDRH